MSRWTHVGGVIRIDGLPGADDKIRSEIQNRLGTIVKYESPREVWELPSDKTTPTGSEGGIEYFFTITGEENSLSRGVITIYADLRDFGTETQILTIVNWLNRLVIEEDNLDFFIRQGVVQVEDEYGGNSGIIYYNGKEFAFEMNEAVQSYR